MCELDAALRAPVRKSWPVSPPLQCDSPGSTSWPDPVGASHDICLQRLQSVAARSTGTSCRRCSSAQRACRQQAASRCLSAAAAAAAPFRCGSCQCRIRADWVRNGARGCRPRCSDPWAYSGSAASHRAILSAAPGCTGGGCWGVLIDECWDGRIDCVHRDRVAGLVEV